MCDFLKKFYVIWIFLMILCVDNQTCNGLRILGLYPFQCKSHFIMSERLLLKLAEKGHQVDVYSHFPQKNPPPNYKDYSLAGSLPDLMNNVTYDFFMDFHPMIISLKFVFGLAGIPLCKLMSLPVFQELLHNPPKNPPYDLIISDVCISLCFIAWSRHLNIPMIDISSNVPLERSYDSRGILATPAVLPVHEHYYKSLDTFFNRLRNFIVYYGVKAQFWYFSKEQNQIVKDYFGPGYPSVWEMQKDLALMFINYHHSLHGIRPFPPSVVPISGIHIVDKNETIRQGLKKWMDESKNGFIYFSFGSMARVETFPKNILLTFYKAFEKIAPTRVLWKVVEPKLLPPNIPKNVKVEKWLPQQQILKHKNIKVFITHGGLMGTLESIYFGVPMIGIPLFAEQFANVDMYVKKKIAVNVDLDKIELEFEKSLFEILKNPDYKKNVKIISTKFKDTPMSPLDTAIYWIEYVARHGKDSLRSPITDMPWWQTSLLDVYAFFFGILILIIYIMKKLLSRVTRLFVTEKQQITKVKKN